ncbi:transcriptional regulator, GntR family with LacI sensor [Candidatus Moduliflexus flocculans]|uniref:Transcriptional regulator, GntR family with LacI sensor n=1 Tax=Candidatus Moduliflexus flocculans TaxID=1499966 RepID=A0A081BSV7_9BACT|nr:transcriptional regulator, GntR family with LacI sensor [Candidatus Moduliflexus flocculans]
MKHAAPKHERIYTFILQLLHSEDFHVGDLLPTEIEFAQQFEVSRPTVMRALNRLEAEGFISRKAGAGSFIQRKPERQQENLVFGVLFPLLGIGEIFTAIAEEIAALSAKYHFIFMWGGKFAQPKMHANQMEEMTDFYIQHGVSGVFLAPMEFSKDCFLINERTVNKLVKAQVPIVLIDADYKEYPERSRFDLVGIDNFRAGYILAEHYIQQGAGRVDFIKPPYSAQTVPQRVRGVQAALFDHGHLPQKSWIHTGDLTDRAFIQHIINSGATNLICSNDAMALQCLQHLETLGIHVPGDVRVAGLDDVKSALSGRIPLTTINQPCQEMGLIAVRAMLERLQSPHLPPRQILLDAELVVRESSKIM